VGHFDEDFDEETDDDASLPPPVLMFSYGGSSSNVRSVSLGWGHTAIVTDDGRLFVSGRPHDFASLLRLRRLPKRLRNYAVRQTYQNTAEAASTAVIEDEDDHNNNGSVPIGGSSSSSGGAGLDVTSLVDRFIALASEVFQLSDTEDWDAARRHSFLTTFTEIELPETMTEDGEVVVDRPVSVQCSAALTAVLTERGNVYAFGQNGYGQCGIGRTSNNVWKPARVLGLSSEFAFGGPRSELPQTHPVTQVALGLQHVLCLNSAGEIFAFGKGDRGQLGQHQQTVDGEGGESHAALPIRKMFRLVRDSDTATAGNSNNDVEDAAADKAARSPPKPKLELIGKVREISAGMIHSAALTENNEVLIWGKNVLPRSFLEGGGVDSVDEDGAASEPADVRLPVALDGLPPGLRVLRIACGSHHTSMLLEDGSVWAVGISSDTKELMHAPTLLVPPGVVVDPETTVRQFDAHMDRTTIVADPAPAKEDDADTQEENREQLVLQVHLWKDPGMREYAVFTPAWIDRLLSSSSSSSAARGGAEDRDGDSTSAVRIREVHRSWIHSVVVVEGGSERD